MYDRTLELTHIVERLASRDGMHPTLVRGLTLNRSSLPAAPLRRSATAEVCLPVRGCERIWMGSECYSCRPGCCMLMTQELPLVRQFLPSDRGPYLGLSLEIDFELVANVMEETKLAPLGDCHRPRIEVHEVDGGLLDAFTRLAMMVDDQERSSVLEALVRKEIYCRLLLSDAGDPLRRMAAQQGHAQRVAKGVEWIRAHATKTIDMTVLARHMGMSLSTMYLCFRSVTSVTPLQFQKHLRLQKARQLMLSESMHAGVAARRVGYRSPAQFSREYRRLFGAPPIQDRDHLRLALGPAARMTL